MSPLLLVVSKVILIGSSGVEGIPSHTCSLEQLENDVWTASNLPTCLTDISSDIKRTGTEFEATVSLVDTRSRARLVCKGVSRTFAYTAKLDDGVIEYFLKMADTKRTAARKLSQFLTTDSVLGKTEKLVLDGIKFYFEKNRAVEVCQAIEARLLDSQGNSDTKADSSSSELKLSPTKKGPAVETTVDPDKEQAAPVVENCTIKTLSESMEGGLICLTSPVGEQDAASFQYRADIYVDANARRVDIKCDSDGSPSFTYSTDPNDPNIGYAFMQATKELQKQHKDESSGIYRFIKVWIGKTKFYYDNIRAVAVCNKVASSAGVVLQKPVPQSVDQVPEGWCAIRIESESVEGLSCITAAVTQADVDNSLLHFTAKLTVNDPKNGQVQVECKGSNGLPTFIYSTIPGQLIRYFLKPVSEEETALMNPISKLHYFDRTTIGGAQYLYDNTRAAGLCNRVGRSVLPNGAVETGNRRLPPPIDLNVDCMLGPEGSRMCSKKHTLRDGCAYEFDLSIEEGKQFRPSQNLFNGLTCWDRNLKKRSDAFAFSADIAITDQGRTYEIGCRSKKVEFRYIVPSENTAVESFIKTKTLMSDMQQKMAGGAKLASFETIKVGSREFFVDKSLAANELCATIGNAAESVQKGIQNSVVDEVVVAGQRTLTEIESEINFDLSKECVEVHGSSRFSVHFCPSRQLLVRRGSDCDFALSGIFSRIDYSLESAEIYVKPIIERNTQVFESCPIGVPCGESTCYYASRVSKTRKHELVCQRRSMGRELMGMVVLASDRAVSEDACGSLLKKFASMQQAFVVPDRVVKNPTSQAEVHVTASEVVVISSNTKCETHFKVPLHGQNWIMAAHELTFDENGKVIRDDDTGSKINELLQGIVTTWKYDTCLDPDADILIGSDESGEVVLKEGPGEMATSIQSILYQNKIGKVSVELKGNKVTLTCHSPKDAGDSVLGTYTFDSESLSGFEKKFGKMTLGRLLKTVTGRRALVSKISRTRLCAHLYSRHHEIYFGISKIGDDLKNQLSHLNKKYQELVSRLAQERV